MKNCTFILFFTLFTLVAATLGSCTIVGLITGAAIDAKQPKNERTIQSGEIAELKKNALVTVYRKDLEPLTGFYRGTIDVKSPGKSDTAAMLLNKKGGSSEQYYIPLEQIDHIYIPARKSNGKLVGLAVGGVVDLALCLIWLNAWR